MSTLFKDPVSNKDSGVLANLWRRVVRESNLQNSLNHLADRYVKKTNPISQRVANVKKRTKSTVLKNISDPDMTIKTFLDLIFNLLGAKKLTISIKITYPNGTETIHSLPINNGDLGHEHGMCQPIKALAGNVVDAVIVGGIGQGAIAKLNSMGIKVYKAQGETIKDNLQLYKENKLQEFSRNHTCSHDGCEHH